LLPGEADATEFDSQVSISTRRRHPIDHVSLILKSRHWASVYFASTLQVARKRLTPQCVNDLLSERKCRKTAPARSAGANAVLLVVEKHFSIKIKSKNAEVARALA
jgi:hypothetical protein